MSLIAIPLPAAELIIRLILLLGLAAHKLVWEVMKRGEESPARSVAKSASSKSLIKSGIKLGKVFFLGFLVIQTIALEAWPISAPPPGLRAVGLLIFLGGLALAIVARLQLGKNWANIEDYQLIPGQSLVQSGVYKFIRHPIYAGDLLLVLGLELALNSWLFILTIPLALVVYRQAKIEEGLLTEKLAAYREYQQHTKMFIPFIV